MRTNLAHGYVDDVQGAVSTGSGWGTHGAGITVPRRPKRAAREEPRLPHAYNSSDVERYSPWSDSPRFDAVSHHETLSNALLEYKLTHSSHGDIAPRNLLGLAAPGAHALLEVFPPALHTYTLVVDALLGSQRRGFSLRSSPSRHVALAMYFASKAAQCTYCTLYSCHLAVRRGAHAGVFSGKRRLSTREAAVSTVASSMAAFPASLTFADRQRLSSVLGRSQVEAVVLAVALMGMLNLTMTACCADLDMTIVTAAGALASASGWTSGHHRVVDRHVISHRNFRSNTNPVRRNARPDRAPPSSDRLLRTDRQPLRGRSLRAFTPAPPVDDSRLRSVPKSWPAVGDYLVANVGHSFPILSRLRSRRAVRALATALLLNLDEHESSVDVEVKYLAALVFATLNGNHLLASEFRGLASTAMTPDSLEAVVTFASSTSDRLTGTFLTEIQRRALLVAKACAMSPPVITQRMVNEMRLHMPPPMIVELVSWLGLVSTLHRLYVFYFPNCLNRNFLHESTMTSHTIDDDDVMSEMSFV